jgi:GST-like protein|tara:strand:+ start:727 stop:1473 length:747 start_codon:yes stop_codon:yes gene_type:complete
MIDLHYAPTMNGHKVAVMLEEVGLPYRIHSYNLLEGEHLSPEFHAINPNHKIPVIVDHDPADGGGPLSVFESGAILMYLAEKTGMLLSTDYRRRELTRQWLTWQVAGLGPMHGQANHFIRYAPPGQEYAIERYSREARRLVDVLEGRLGDVEYLAEEYSIADIACWAFISTLHTIDIDIADFPNVLRWRSAINQRPAVVRVVTDELTATPAALLEGEMKLTEEQWSNVFGERMRGAANQKKAMNGIKY